MFETIFKEKLGPLALRLALAFVCIYHGYLKIMADGGTTWHAALATTWQLLIAWSEFAAGVAILLGFRCRQAACVLLTLTAGTLLAWHGWRTFQLPLRTLEPHIVFLLLGLSLLCLGAGDWSLDSRGAGNAGAATSAFGKRKMAA